MAEFRIVTTINAPIELCFDLSRDIDFHTRTMEGAGERAAAGRVTGLIELGETVTWEARRLGVHQRLTSKITAFDRPNHFQDTMKITAFDRPNHFQDTMTAGAFHSFAHDHLFEVRNGVTIIIDEVVFRSPFGPIGLLVDTLFMTGYLRRLLEVRGRMIKREAESLTTAPPVISASSQ